MRASELLLIVRAQNQASGALRRLAGDMRGLSALGDLRRQRDQLQINRQSLMNQRARAQAELESLTTGKRAQELAARRTAQELALQSAVTRRAVTERQIHDLGSRQLLNEAQRGRLLARTQMAARIGSPAMARDASLRFQAAAQATRGLAMEEAILQRRMNTATEAVDLQQAKLNNLAAAESRAAQRAAELQSTIHTTGNRLALNTQQIEENNRAIRRAPWNTVATGGRILQHTARVMEYAGLILGGTLAATAHAAAGFNTQVGLAATQTRSLGASANQTVQHTQVLQKQILGLMRQFPATSQDMSKAAYDIYSSTNVSFRGGLRALKLFNQAAVAGQTDVATATRAGITVLNNFGSSVSALPEKLQRMFSAVRFGRMTFADFANSISFIGPAARAAGQSFDDMAAAFAFLTRHLNIGQARSGYARLLEILSGPQMQKGLKALHVNIDTATGKLKPLDQVIGILLQKFPYLARGGVRTTSFFKDIGGLQGTIQARRAFTYLTQFFDKAGKDGASYQQMIQQVKKDNNEFTTSLQAMEKTTGVRWGTFVNRLKSLALAFGAAVIPALMAVAGPLEHLTKWWENLSNAAKHTIARFATFSAVFLLVGGAVAFLGGTFLRLVAVFGRLLGFGAGLGATFTVVALAAAALTGHIKALSDVLTVIANFAFGSFTGFAITMGIATMAAIRLTAALRGLSAVEGLTAGGGLLAGLLGRGRGAIAGAQIGREAGGIRGLLTGAAAGAGLLSGSLLPVIGIVGAIGAGLYLWKRHIDAARRSAEELSRENLRIQTLAQAPGVQASIFGRLGINARSIVQARLQLREIDRSIAAAKKQATTPAGRDALQQLYLDRANALDVLHAANYKANVSSDAFTASIQAQARNFVALAQTRQRLQDIQAHENATLGVGRFARMTDAQLGRFQAGEPFAGFTSAQFTKVKEQTQAHYDALFRSIGVNGRKLKAAFGRSIQDMVDARLIPRISTKVLDDLFNTALKAHRALTIPEIRAIIRAEVHKGDLNRIPASIRSIFARIHTQRIRIETQLKTPEGRVASAAGKAVASVIAQILPDIKGAHNARSKIANVFKKTIPQQVQIHVNPPNFSGIGASIAQGIASGINGNTGLVTGAINAILGAAHAAATASIQKNSPSRLFRDTIGKPITQGIIVGILEESGNLQKAATITIDLFQGAALKAANSKKKVTGTVLAKDLQSQLKTYHQFNTALARLAHRGAPQDLIDALAALGPDAAGKIDTLSRLSAPALRRYIALWHKAQAEVKHSMRYTQQDFKDAMKQMADSAAQHMLDVYNTFKDAFTQGFGTLFAGPNNLAQMVGTNFSDALDQYNTSVADYKSQLAGLNQQLVDINTQAIDSMQQSFGDLFSGDWMQGDVVRAKIDWNQALGFDDLYKDLQGQIDKFRHWRDTLKALARRVPPELAAQLEKLGPDAANKLDALNSATDSQLADYVNLWRSGQDSITQAAQDMVSSSGDIQKQIKDILVQIDDVTQKLAALQAPHALTPGDILKDIHDQQNAFNDWAATLDDLKGRKLPFALLQQLQQMGPDALPYLKALNSMTQGQLNEFVKAWTTSQDAIAKASQDFFTQQLSDWRSHGQKLALQLIAGIADEQKPLLDFFKKLFTNLLSGKGVPTATPNTYTGPDVGPPDPWMTKSGVGNTINYNSTQTVIAHQDESLDSTLARAAFRQKTRVPE